MAILKLLDSKSALVALAIIICATVLAGLAKIPWSEWKEIAMWIGIAYIGGEKALDAAAAWREGAKGAKAVSTPAPKE